MARVPITDDSFAKTYDGLVVPPHIRGGIMRYINEGVQVGSFLEAVFCNDLREAMGRADEDNRRGLYATVSWLYNESPNLCWGSEQRYNAWLAAHAIAHEGGTPPEEAPPALHAAFDQVRAVRGLP